VGEGVQRYRDAEVVFELANELEHLQRVEAEVGEQFAVRLRIDRMATEAPDDVQGVAFESVGGRCRVGTRRGSPALGIVLDQAVKCSTNLMAAPTV
jgi:hypothetical protein